MDKDEDKSIIKIKQYLKEFTFQNRIAAYFEDDKSGIGDSIHVLYASDCFHNMSQSERDELIMNFIMSKDKTNEHYNKISLLILLTISEYSKYKEETFELSAAFKAEGFKLDFENVPQKVKVKVDKIDSEDFSRNKEYEVLWAEPTFDIYDQYVIPGKKSYLLQNDKGKKKYVSSGHCIPIEVKK